MKKFLVLILSVLLLSGCSNSNNVTPILNNISFSTKIVYNDIEYICNASIGENNDFKLCVVSPEQIKGLTYVVNDASETEFFGVSYVPDVNSLPLVLCTVLKDVKNKKIIRKGENCTVVGEVNNYKYTVVFSPAGLPLILRVDDLNLQVEFYDIVLN